MLCPADVRFQLPAQQAKCRWQNFLLGNMTPVHKIFLLLLPNVLEKIAISTGKSNFAMNRYVLYA